MAGIRKNYWVRVKVDYPKNKKVCGEFEGVVTNVGCFRTGFAFFKLDKYPKLTFPNSSKYVQVLESRPNLS